MHIACALFAWHLPHDVHYLLSPVRERMKRSYINMFTKNKRQKRLFLFRILSEDERTQSQFLSPSKKILDAVFTLFLRRNDNDAHFQVVADFLMLLPKIKLLNKRNIYRFTFSAPHSTRQGLWPFSLSLEYARKYFARLLIHGLMKKNLRRIYSGNLRIHWLTGCSIFRSRIMIADDNWNIDLGGLNLREIFEWFFFLRRSR